MRSIKYLNTVLTVIAVLLALQLWTLWTVGPVGQSDGPIGFDTPAQAVGIPNAGQQRKQIADAIKQLSGQVESLGNLFRSGQARVRIEGQASSGD